MREVAERVWKQVFGVVLSVVLKGYAEAFVLGPHASTWTTLQGWFFATKP
jgi:hypothetical protein